jgi:DNA-binding response OmpR family regulator
LFAVITQQPRGHQRVPEGRILVVEDHRDIAEMVCEHLGDSGFVCDFAADGLTGLHLAATQDFDAIVLDLMLPGISGLDLCRRLGEGGKRPPVLMLTARDTLSDKLSGFQSGADDYMVKPFDVAELEARLRAIIRRARSPAGTALLSVGPLSINTDTQTVCRDNQTIALTPIGFSILKILMRESPRVVTRARLEMEIWGDALPDSDVLRSHMYKLRTAVDRPFDRPLIHTVQRTGFRLTDTP